MDFNRLVRNRKQNLGTCPLAPVLELDRDYLDLVATARLVLFSCRLVNLRSIYADPWRLWRFRYGSIL